MERPFLVEIMRTVQNVRRFRIAVLAYNSRSTTYPVAPSSATYPALRRKVLDAVARRLGAVVEKAR